MNKLISKKLRYMLIYASTTFVAYLIDAYVINITGFLIGAVITSLYIKLDNKRLKGDR